MNEVLRILDRFLKRHGYSVKKHSEYNLLPLQDFSNFNDQKRVFDSFSSANSKTQDSTAKLEICLRTCISDKRVKNKQNEITNLSLDNHLFGCINSLVVSANNAVKKGKDINLTVFDDRSEKEAADKIRDICTKLKCDWQFVTTDKTGQGESLHQHFAYAKDKDTLVYFCEDDYLHIPTAVYEMIEFYNKVYNQTGTHLLIHPQEHELIYSQFNYPSYILLDDNRRWRTISHATHTFFTHAKIVNKYWKYFENTKFVGVKEKRHLGSEKKTTDLLFKHVPGFSPIPAVAIHFQTKQSMPPFFDWKELWDNQIANVNR